MSGVLEGECSLKGFLLLRSPQTGGRWGGGEAGKVAEELAARPILRTLRSSCLVLVPLLLPGVVHDSDQIRLEMLGCTELSRWVNLRIRYFGAFNTPEAEIP